ncbi:nSTAND1 domain-containing NTPase [Catenuloplanes japonicus]|uniref:nSTAND1 domain-containing NTPase n=1 Tax=Catenuloplanes japonicus TaxID=33876 RepID=UPI0006895BC1|nr:hypothetical protein [Catenuloplanes japonicus]
MEQFAAGLRELRDKAGRPGYRQMAARVNYSVATLSAAASGRRLPTLEVTLAYVAGCDGDPAEWERRWRETERLTVATAEPDRDGPSPYPGLATFQAEDAAVFFGRGALVGELVRRLGERRFLAVFGPSGAGKSSVVRAGLVPAMGGPVMVMTPGAHPMAELAVQLARHAGVPAGGLLAELREDPARAHLMVRQGVPGDADLLVVVDQFEETFATCDDPAERAEFIAALLAMCREPDGRARVVLAVRADHYARFTEHPALLAALTDAQVLIGGMTPAELREAVTRPAERRGARVEGALAATIVAEVTDRPGALPLAAHALREAWRRRQGAMVTLGGYEAAGGVAGAVAHTAERTYERLSAPQQRVTQRVLLRMIDVGRDGLITRRRLRRDELDTIDLAPVVIDALAAARLVTTDRDTIEIAHEALIRAWPRLRGWVETHRAGLRLHRQLTEAATVWATLGRDDGALYRGLRLSTTIEAGIPDLTAAEQDFLDASRALRDREARHRQRRTRWLVAGLTAVLVLVSALATGAVVSAFRAESERGRAVARELAAGARAERMTDPELALALALRAYRLHPDAETESVLRQATADARGTYTMAAHRTEVYSVAVSGSQVASADMDGTVKVWDIEGRTPPVDAPVDGTVVAAGPDGWLAIACVSAGNGYSRVVLWRPGEAGPGRTLQPLMPAFVSSVAYSADGRWVAAAGDDQQVYVWDTAHNDLRTTMGFTGEAADLAFGPGGRLALSANDGTVRVWNLGTTDPPTMIRQPQETFSSSVAVSPDGRRIAVASSEQVTVWPIDGSAAPETYRGEEYWYTSVAFSPDGRRIAAGTDERTVRVWDVSDGARGLAIRGHHGAVRDVAFTQDGRRLVSAGDDATVRVWDTTAAADPATVTFPAAPLPAMLGDDGVFTAAPSGSGTISVFPTRTPERASTLRDAPTGSAFLAVSANGRSVAAAPLDSEQILWWDTTVGDRPAVLDCGQRLEILTANGVTFSRDGTVLVAECGDNDIRVWRAGGGPEPGRMEGGGPIAINADATLLASARWPQGIVLRDLDGRPVWTPKGQAGRAAHLRFSPDGRLLAVAGTDGAIRVWTVGQDIEPAVLTGLTGQITGIGFSADGRLIVGIGGNDEQMRVWNTDGGGGPLVLEPPAASRSVAFSDDGRQIITVYGQHARFTPCEVCGPVREVMDLAGRRAIRDLTAEERAKYLHEPG